MRNNIYIPPLYLCLSFQLYIIQENKYNVITQRGGVTIVYSFALLQLTSFPSSIIMFITFECSVYTTSDICLQFGVFYNDLIQRFYECANYNQYSLTKHAWLISFLTYFVQKVLSISIVCVWHTKHASLLHNISCVKLFCLCIPWNDKQCNIYLDQRLMYIPHRD